MLSTSTSSLSARSYGTVDPAVPPIVVLPGLGVSRYLRAACAALAASADRRVLLVDPPGFGVNAYAVQEEPVTLAAVADVLAPWLDALGPVLLAGQSTGSLLAARVARHSVGLQVRGLALVSPTFDPDRRSLPAAAVRLLLDGPNEPWWLAPTQLPEWVRNAGALPSYLLSCLHERLEEHLDDVRCAVVVTRGDRDPLSRYEWAASLSDRPDRTLVSVPGGGHTYMAGDPRSFALSLAAGHFAGGRRSRA